MTFIPPALTPLESKLLRRAEERAKPSLDGAEESRTGRIRNRLLFRKVLTPALQRLVATVEDGAHREQLFGEMIELAVLEVLGTREGPSLDPLKEGLDLSELAAQVANDTITKGGFPQMTEADRQMLVKFGVHLAHRLLKREDLSQKGRRELLSEHMASFVRDQLRPEMAN